jgi:hypothetical protein
LKNPWFAWFDAATLAAETATFAAETQWVVALRMSRLAGGGALAASEAQRMISEKIMAGAQAQVAAGMALAAGRGMEGAARAAVRPFRRAVRANRRRLSRS